MANFIKVSALFGFDEEDENILMLRPTLELNMDKVGDKTINEIYRLLHDFSKEQEMLKDYTIRDATPEELKEDAEDV